MLLSLHCPLHFILPRTIYSFPLSFVFLLHRAVATILTLTFPSNLSDCRSRCMIRYNLSWTFSNRIQCIYVCTDFGFLFIYKVLIFLLFISDQRNSLSQWSSSLKYRFWFLSLLLWKYQLGVILPWDSRVCCFFSSFFLYMCMNWIWLLSDLGFGQFFMFFCLLTVSFLVENVYIYIYIYATFQLVVMV